MLNINEIIKDHNRLITQLETQIPFIEQLATLMVNSLRNGGKIFWMGNGGSAADAQHLAAELIGRFKHERVALASLALNTDTSVLTSLANDYDYSCVFARQLEALCNPNDIVVGLTTSGNSLNVIKGLDVARAKGAVAIAFTGHQGGKVIQSADHNFIVPSTITERIQEVHIFVGHLLCEYIEQSFL